MLQGQGLEKDTVFPSGPTGCCTASVGAGDLIPACTDGGKGNGEELMAMRTHSIVHWSEDF